MTITGLVLAAGASDRLGRPKQLLPFRGHTLLDATLEVARRCPFDQLLVTIGGAAEEVRAQVDLTGVEVVDNVDFTSGCASSIVAALGQVDPASEGLVLLLGDQPGVTVEAVEAVVGVGTGCSLAVVRYDEGVGHPFWFGRDVFAELAALHGDKAVWKLLESGRHPVREVRIAGRVPLDVDTWEDYEALLALEGAP